VRMPFTDILRQSWLPRAFKPHRYGHPPSGRSCLTGVQPQRRFGSIFPHRSRWKQARTTAQ
jgi:hypothetical protein